MQHVGQRLADDVIEREQNEQRDERPEAAARGRDALLFIEGHQLLLILLLVVAIFGFERLGQRRQARHLQHALLALDGQRQQNDLDDQREQDQRQAIVARELVEPLEQIAERDADNVRQAHAILCRRGGLLRSLCGCEARVGVGVVLGGRRRAGAQRQRQQNDQQQCYDFFHNFPPLGWAGSSGTGSK